MTEYYKNKAQIDEGYETYQVIRDFDDAIQIFREAFQNSIDEDATEVFCQIKEEQRLGEKDLIIDIWDNGSGLQLDEIPCFFGLAKSTKVDSNKLPKGKLGYKGHGTKIFFNAERIDIYSKPENNSLGWGVALLNPLKQLRESNEYRYSDIIPHEQSVISLPSNYQTGFFVRITNPYYFKTQNTRFMLNHIFLRDYSKWYTVFGNIKSYLVPELPKAELFLRGVNIDQFKNIYKETNSIDPFPVFSLNNNVEFEKIRMGHYFPPDRRDDKSMKAYVEVIGSDKPYYDYYSRMICNEKFHLSSGVDFDFILNVEGLETKRRYDVLLSQRRKTPFDEIMIHTDASRYGLWACKGGVPIENVDKWIEGGRGIGTYTYLHAFINCDSFELTGNRGSISPTDWETIDLIKKKINEIWSDTNIQKNLKEREAWEDFEKRTRSVKEDNKELKTRYSACKTKKIIKTLDGDSFTEPLKLKSGYSESETFMLLIEILNSFPGLFNFNILDYNTNKGIDFVVEYISSPKYIELKGTFQKKVNHSFRNLFKFICYDVEMKQDDILEDVEPIKMRLHITKEAIFESSIDKYNGKKYTAYQLVPINPSMAQGMEIIVLKSFIQEVLC